MKTFKDILKEAKNDNEECAKEIFNDLFNKSINKTTSIDNYWKEVLKKHNLKKSDKDNIISLVKKKGYKGNLLDN